MPLLRFRIYWEDDDQTYRDIELRPAHTFSDLHHIILTAYEFDNKHAASFYECDERWVRNGRELSSEVQVNKKDAPALSMARTPVSALVQKTDQKFVYVYDPAKHWTFLLEMIGVSKEEDPKRTYPAVIRKEGLAPAQYGIKGSGAGAVIDKIMEVEEQYDLNEEEMAEGFSNEGEEPAAETGSGSGFDE